MESKTKEELSKEKRITRIKKLALQFKEHKPEIRPIVERTPKIKVVKMLNPSMSGYKSVSNSKSPKK